jgi:hypothetical protein
MRSLQYTFTIGIESQIPQPQTRYERFRPLQHSLPRKQHIHKLRPYIYSQFALLHPLSRFQHWLLTCLQELLQSICQPLC